MAQVKAISRTIDVNNQYFLREAGVIPGFTSNGFIHFACTSEDINNTCPDAFRLS
jgi:adenylosuccinate lyase